MELPELDLEGQRENNHCFGCGHANPIGLKLKVEWDENTRIATTKFTPDANLQGWTGYVHGGIITCALDETMCWAGCHAGYNNVTAKLQIRFKKIGPLGQSYTVICNITRETPRLIETEAKLIGQDGLVYAEGTSTQFVVDPVRSDKT